MIRIPLPEQQPMSTHQQGLTSAQVVAAANLEASDAATAARQEQELKKESNRLQQLLQEGFKKDIAALNKHKQQKEEEHQQYEQQRQTILTDIRTSHAQDHADKMAAMKATIYKPEYDRRTARSSQVMEQFYQIAEQRAQLALLPVIGPAEQQSFRTLEQEAQNLITERNELTTELRSIRQMLNIEERQESVLDFREELRRVASVLLKKVSTSSCSSMSMSSGSQDGSSSCSSLSVSSNNQGETPATTSVQSVSCSTLSRTAMSENKVTITENPTYQATSTEGQCITVMGSSFVAPRATADHNTLRNLGTTFNDEGFTSNSTSPSSTISNPVSPEARPRFTWYEEGERASTTPITIPHQLATPGLGAEQLISADNTNVVPPPGTATITTTTTSGSSTTLGSYLSVTATTTTTTLTSNNK
jgi:hypothetical protein